MKCSFCGKEANLTVWKGEELRNCCMECLEEDRRKFKEGEIKDRQLTVSCVWNVSLFNF